MEKYDKYDLLKNQLKETDKEILYLLKRREQVEKRIVKHTYLKNEYFTDKNFEDELIKENISQALTMGLNSNFINELYVCILKHGDEYKEKEYQKLQLKK